MSATAEPSRIASSTLLTTVETGASAARGYDAISWITRRRTSTEGKEGTPIRLKAQKGSKQRSRERCKAQTKAGGVCPAPAVERGLCFFHAHPEKLAELGRQGGKSNRRWDPVDGNLSKIPLKSIGDVSALLEETMKWARRVAPNASR